MSFRHWMRKAHEAKMAGASELTVWGSGSPRREFLHVDDLSQACLFLMDHYDDLEPVNVGTGQDITIRELAELIREIVDFEGRLVWDSGKPDGTPRKLLDITQLKAMGWSASISLRKGLSETYDWYCEQGHQAF